MIDKKVKFKVDSLALTGMIRDKVCIPIASGTKEYISFDQYVIEEERGTRDYGSNRPVHLVSPLCILEIIPS